jgi:hypothetical protein
MQKRACVGLLATPPWTFDPVLLSNQEYGTMSVPSKDSLLVRWPKSLLIVGAVYLAWLLWLAYVAWINVQAGNP